MQEAKRQELLRVLGVDRYQRRTIAQPVPVVDEENIEQTQKKIANAKPPVEVNKSSSAEPEVHAPKSKQKKSEVKANRKSAKAQPLTLLWWQFEDLLFVESASPGASSGDPNLFRLVQNIATALGRSKGLNGELHWPPGGDFDAISEAEFLSHFVRGRSESLDDELKLILTSSQLVKLTDQFPNTRQIESLSAMLADPSLKSSTWQTLKTLRRP